MSAQQQADFETTEKLFSYGTLQTEAVQWATFGRKLNGAPDVLSGYGLSMLRISDPGVVATSGAAHHPMVEFTGRAADAVSGTVFEITVDELRQADEYEVSDYRRVSATLDSGVTAWVYAAAETGVREQIPLIFARIVL